MRLVCQITNSPQPNGTVRWYTNVENLDDGTGIPCCILVADEYYKAELNAKQIFNLLSRLTFPHLDLSGWSNTLQ